MNQRIEQLINRLSFFGYCSFEIKRIIKEAVGIECVNDLSITQRVAVINHLEKYEQLGLSYLQTYSK
ncbi:hypothetical protein [Sporomusa sphaeroides]|jgi:hypothetical protein|uniref:Uncharacterized protein n=2 Tax=Sporomusa TaxID=2375 RepID=A0ABM9W1P5_9FIRM|nr:hypothetical protein [Sporomusa sphaeroides]MCM0757875.1 hypothetical protein [Sporomusa sphaeroides DSM 2875]OLS57544.1 hypothetical protein SPSPH_10600 [Sporomusa sphaeroides DSM 2875]CVK17892.1 hypothetical protein SSPH_00528 [Sporomusa sphaeroides DSM 2875]SCM81106.1 conserved hypothetical protein [uncultured Sporomusa sp.]